jgi:uncharacterized integral membrane protein
MRWARRAIAVALFVGAVYVCIRFPAQNAESVSVDYLFGRVEGLPLWLALLGAFGAGLLLAALIGFYKLTRLRLVARRYRKTAHGLEAEIHELRNLPLAGSEARGDGVGGDPGTSADPALERGV